MSKELWVPTTYGTTIASCGDFPVARCLNADDEAYVSFKVPDDFASIDSALLVVIVRATQGAADWDISSDYGAVGEAFDIHSESDTATTYNVTNDQKFGIDISGILSSLAAGDYVGIKLIQKDAAHDVYVLGVHFKYS